jgi:hypothetical protein
LNRSSITLRVFALFGLALLAAGALAFGTGPVRAVQSEEHPPQREWVYQDYADVVTGEMYPAAFLMTRKPVDASGNAAGIGHGYLSVGNYSKRPMEVTLAWDEPLSRTRAVNCKPGGCELTVRFGTGASTKFIALQDKHSPALILQDGRAFVAVAGRHVGTIEVQVQTLGYGLVTLQFSTANRLQVEKLSRPKR